MKIQRFVVEFDNAVAVYKQGDEVSGRVHLSLLKPLKLKGLRLQIVGEASVRWEYGKTKVSKSDTHHIFKSEEKYFDYKTTLHGRDENDNKSKSVELGLGQYDFTFSYTLPTDESLPTSLEGAYGYIRYYARAVIDRPATKHNCWTIKPFTVLGVLDLNLDETSLVPSSCSSTQKMTSCLCCTSGKRTVSVGLNRTGYCPGECILITATVDNDTSNKILRSCAELIQTVEYRGGHKTICGVKMKARKTQKSIQSVRGEGCASHSILKWENFPLIVPAIPPSKLDGCSFIDIQYSLRFTIFMKDKKSVMVEAPVLIGTEPLRSCYPMYHEGMEPIPSAPLECEVTAGVVLELPPYDCPPPSYEACIYGGATLTEDEFTMGQTTFTPLYQVYNTLRSQTRSAQATMNNRVSSAAYAESEFTSTQPIATVVPQQHVASPSPPQSPLSIEQQVSLDQEEDRFNPEAASYVYATPASTVETQNFVEYDAQHSRVDSVGSSNAGSTGIGSPISATESHPMFTPRPISTSPPLARASTGDSKSPAEVFASEEVLDDDEGSSTGLPDDSMIPLSEAVTDDEQLEDAPSAPQHPPASKYNNDFVAVENEIYMAYGQDGQHAPPPPTSDRESRRSKLGDPPPVPLPGPRVRLESDGKGDRHNSSHIDSNNLADSGLPLADNEGTSSISDVHSDEQDLYMDEATA